MKKKSPTKKKRHAGQPQNLTPGRTGKPTHVFVAPQAWDTFCINWRLTGKRNLAAVRAGYDANYGFHLAKHPWIIARMKEITDEMVTTELVKAHKAHVLSAEFLDDQTVDVAQNGEDGEGTGRARMIYVGYKRLGLIQNGGNTIVNAQANAQAGIGPGGTAYQVYEAAWLTRKKAGWERELEIKHGTDSDIAEAASD